MKKLTTILLLFLFTNPSAYSQMTVETQHLLPNRTILEATFNIFYNSVNATAFIVKCKKGQYLITAKHLFGNISNSGTLVNIRIKGGNIDNNLQRRVYFHENPHVDIAVLKLDTMIITGETLPLGKGSDYFLAQECLFLGYPLFNLGTQTEIGKVAFVKKAIISAFYEENKVKLMLLDGHNNPGFSGGPVITYSENMNKQFIIGVISGYINQKQNVNLTYGKTTGQLTINENSGIIICYPAEYIDEIINKLENNVN